MWLFWLEWAAILLLAARTSVEAIRFWREDDVPEAFGTVLSAAALIAVSLKAIPESNMVSAIFSSILLALALVPNRLLDRLIRPKKPEIIGTGTHENDKLLDD